MTPILSALAQGYGEEELLGFIQKLFPNVVPKVKKATSAGYNVKQILNFLNGAMQEENYPKHLTPNEIDALRREKYGNITKKIVGTAATALGGMGVARNAANVLGNILPPVGPAPMSNAPVQPQPLSPEAIARASSTETLNAVTPEFQQWANQQIAQGNEKPLAVALREFQELKEQEQKQQNIDKATRDLQQQKSLQITPVSPQVEQLPETETAPKKGVLVASPDGTIGHLESIRPNSALVKDETGKLHKVKSEDLIESPLPEKDLAQLHDDLIKGIEKEIGEDVSRMVNFAGYDANKNELAFLPYTGALYIYKNISPEDAAFLTNIQNMRKTSGENFIGVWKEGTKSPIGSAMNALIQRLQKERGGKGNEYEAKYETIYSALEPAHRAKKKKHSQRKKNERPTT